MLTARFPRMIPAAAALSEIDHLVGQVFPEFPAFAGSARRFPAINAWEDDQSLYLEAELPGFKIEDLDITLSGNELTISGTRAQTNVEGATFHRRERASGTFSRTIRLGAEVEAGKVAAALENGVLTVTLPKSEAAKPRKIEVKAAERAT